MRFNRLALAWTICASVARADAGMVDDARLLGANADPGNRITYGRDCSNQRFSPLGRIDAGNVATLAPRWVYQSSVPGTFQATPLVVDGTMFLSLPFNHVVALDARTGRELWRYNHKRRTISAGRDGGRVRAARETGPRERIAVRVATEMLVALEDPLRIPDSRHWHRDFFGGFQR